MPQGWKGGEPESKNLTKSELWCEMLVKCCGVGDCEPVLYPIIPQCRNSFVCLKGHATHIHNGSPQHDSLDKATHVVAGPATSPKFCQVQ